MIPVSPDINYSVYLPLLCKNTNTDAVVCGCGWSSLIHDNAITRHQRRYFRALSWRRLRCVGACGAGKKKKERHGPLQPLQSMSLHTPTYLNRHTYDSCCAGGRHGPFVVHTYKGLVELAYMGRFSSHTTRAAQCASIPPPSQERDAPPRPPPSRRASRTSFPTSKRALPLVASRASTKWAS
jgi:hypothetical protein